MHMPNWKAVREEIREVVWLASVVGGLSVLGITVAIVLRFALST
jgi:hypothetical protein